MRIYVVGGPGSGKTTLAVALSRDLGIPLLQLDDVWVRSYERERTDIESGERQRQQHSRQGRCAHAALRPTVAQDPADAAHQIMLAFAGCATASARSRKRHAQSRQSMRLESAS